MLLLALSPTVAAKLVVVALLLLAVAYGIVRHEKHEPHVPHGEARPTIVATTLPTTMTTGSVDGVGGIAFDDGGAPPPGPFPTFGVRELLGDAYDVTPPASWIEKSWDPLDGDDPSAPTG